MGSNVIAEIPELNRYEAMMDILQDDGSRNYTDNIGFGETFYNEGNRYLTYDGSNTGRLPVIEEVIESHLTLWVSKTKRPFITVQAVRSSKSQTSFLSPTRRL